MFKLGAIVLAFLMPMTFGKVATTENDSNTPPPANIGMSPQYFSPSKDKKKGKIQVALLLDTSNSMDGLIDQAKSQIWKMVNKLAAAKKNEEYTDIEIALFEYGNDQLEMGEGYIRMVSSLSKDVDGLSEQLFKLKTNGGSEYCGWVIGDALKNLKWSDDDNDLRLIIIAGNEPFDQGPKDFKETCKDALKKGIVINAVHCGDWQTGIQTHWKEGAEIAKGKYLNIEQDRKIIHIRTPYDDYMYQLNIRLNKTYIGYGATGGRMKERQVAQDKSAAEYGTANVAARAAYKAKVQYSNADWDVVDAYKADSTVVKKMRQEELPEEMKGMNESERKVYIDKMKKERESISKEIQETEKKIQEYTAKELKANGDNMTLDKVMQEAVVQQAIAKGFKFEDK